MWSFVPGFDASRRRNIEAFATFEEILDAIQERAEIAGVWLCPADDLGPPDCWRPTVALRVGPDVFDAFFNGPVGYRAYYLTNPDEGQAVNGRILRTLEKRLTAGVLERCGEKHLSAESVRNSFLANSAKIWRDEEELGFEEATIDLAIDQWRKPCQWVNAPKHSGLWAPRGERLKIFGAFIDPYGNEVVSRKKILRRFDIHECGYS